MKSTDLIIIAGVGIAGYLAIKEASDIGSDISSGISGAFGQIGTGFGDTLKSVTEVYDSTKDTIIERIDTVKESVTTTIDNTSKYVTNTSNNIQTYIPGTQTPQDIARDKAQKDILKIDAGVSKLQGSKPSSFVPVAGGGWQIAGTNIPVIGAVNDPGIPASSTGMKEAVSKYSSPAYLENKKLVSLGQDIKAGATGAPYTKEVQDKAVIASLSLSQANQLKNTGYVDNIIKPVATVNGEAAKVTTSSKASAATAPAVKASVASGAKSVNAATAEATKPVSKYPTISVKKKK